MLVQSFRKLVLLKSMGLLSDFHPSSTENNFKFSTDLSKARLLSHYFMRRMLRDSTQA